jgi:hypothetical protein
VEPDIKYSKLRILTSIAKVVTYAAARRGISRSDYVSSVLARGLIQDNPEVGRLDWLQIHANFPLPDSFQAVSLENPTEPVKLSWKAHQEVAKWKAAAEADKARQDEFDQEYPR